MHIKPNDPEPYDYFLDDEAQKAYLAENPKLRDFPSAEFTRIMFDESHAYHSQRSETGNLVVKAITDLYHSTLTWYLSATPISDYGPELMEG